MGKARNADYELPELSSKERAAREKQIPKTIRVLAFAGLNKPLKMFQSYEDELSKKNLPLALMKTDHFTTLFGERWARALEQSQSEPPMATLGSVASPKARRRT